MTRALLIAASGLALALAGCSKPQFTPDKQYGSGARLPDPVQYLFPPMGIAKPIGWQNGATPTAPAGFTVTAFASDLKTPRRVLPRPIPAPNADASSPMHASTRPSCAPYDWG